MRTPDTKSRKSIWKSDTKWVDWWIWAGRMCTRVSLGRRDLSTRRTEFSAQWRPIDINNRNSCYDMFATSHFYFLRSRDHHFGHQHIVRRRIQSVPGGSFSVWLFVLPLNLSISITNGYFWCDENRLGLTTAVSLEQFWFQICLLWNQCYSTIGVSDWIFSFWIWNNGQEMAIMESISHFQFLSLKKHFRHSNAHTQKTIAQNWEKLCPKIAVNCRRRVHDVFLPERTAYAHCMDMACFSAVYQFTLFVTHTNGTPSAEPNRWLNACVRVFRLARETTASTIKNTKRKNVQLKLNFQAIRFLVRTEKLTASQKIVNEVNVTQSEHCCVSSATHPHPAPIFYAFSFGWAKWNVHHTRSTTREVCASSLFQSSTTSLSCVFR